MEYGKELLEEMVARIRSVSDPEVVILFGSWARGEASDDSDVDLLVIMDSDLPRYRRAISLRRALKGFGPQKDILVYTASEVDEWRTAPTSLIATALREGKVLYEKRH